MTISTQITTTSVEDLALAGKVTQHTVIAQVLKESQPYIERLRGRILVIKLGGSTLDNQLDALEDIVYLRGLGAHPVLIHGGGKEINIWLRKVGIEPHIENGLRITDPATLEIIRMVLVGKINGELVRLLSQLRGQAIGLSGLDGHLLQARQLDPRLGHVGRITKVSSAPIELLCSAGYIPVITPIALDENSEPLNINADDAAADLARGLHAAKLLYLSDVPGILDQHKQLVSQATTHDIEILIDDGTITGGMLPKVQACLRALDTTDQVHIVDGHDPHVLIRELFTHQGAGTMITS